MLDTVDAIVDALGGTGKAAALAGVQSATVSNWKARGGIPTEHFFVFSEALGKTGLAPAPAVFGFKLPAEARA